MPSVAAALAIRLTADTSGLTKEFKDVEAQTDKLASGISKGFEIPSLESFGKSLAGAAAGLLTLGAAVKGIETLGLLIRDVVETSSKLTDLAAKTSISIRELQRLEFAGAQVGVSLDTISTAASQLQKRLAGDDKGAASAVRELGLNLDHLLTLGAGAQFEAIASALGKMENPARATFLAMELFGRGGAALLPLLRADMQALGDEAERLGAVMSDKVVKAGDDLGDSWTKLSFVGRNLSAEVVSPFVDLMDKGFFVITNLGTAFELLLSQIDGLLPAWRQLNSLMGAAFGEVGTPTLPGAPKGFGSFAAGNIRGGKTLLPGITDATDAQKLFDEELKASTAEAKRAADAIKRLMDAQKKFDDRLSGQDALDKATETMAGIARIGGFGELGPDAVLRVHKELDEALEVLAKRGKLASQEMVNLWAASMPRPEVISGINNLIGKLGKLVEAPIPPVFGPGFTPGLGGLGIPGTDVGIPDFAAGAVSPFREAFRNFGKELPDLMFGALMAGGGIGSVVGSLTMALGAQFSAQFAEALKVAGGDLSKLSKENKALGVAAMAIQVGAQGFQLGQQFGKGKGALAGAASGALAGTAIMPGIGTAVGAGVGALMGFFGGRSKEKKEKKAMEEDRQRLLEQFGGMEKLKDLAKDLGVNIDLAFTTKKPAEFQAAVESLNTALEKQKLTIESIGKIVEGVNARAANVTSQGDLDVVGAGAVAGFALQMQEGATAVQAFQALTPAITAMKDAMASGNFTLSESAMRLMEIGGILDQNAVQFANLGASGQIMQAMLQGNIRDGALFAAVATDIGTQIQTVIDRGVPMAQVFALAQPQLQALWEAQKKWGFAVDDTTQALLTEAEAQGFVGTAMKSVNAQILEVLVAIGKVLGADIPAALAGLPAAAQAAADGMQHAFDGIKGPNIQAPWVGDLPTSDPTPDDMTTMSSMRAAGAPAMAAMDGAIQPAGGQTQVVFEQDGQQSAEFIVPHIPGVVQRYGLA